MLRERYRAPVNRKISGKGKGGRTRCAAAVAVAVAATSVSKCGVLDAQHLVATAVLDDSTDP